MIINVKHFNSWNIPNQIGFESCLFVVPIEPFKVTKYVKTLHLRRWKKNVHFPKM